MGVPPGPGSTRARPSWPGGCGAGGPRRTCCKYDTANCGLGGVGLRLLANLTVDASGVDLSQAKVQGLDALEGVIWDMATTWPPLLADGIRAHSKPKLA